MKIKHFLITRFNYSPEYKHLEQRIELFRRYTMPSIYAQTTKNFEWLIIGQPSFNIPGARCFFEACEKPLPTTITAKYMEYIKMVSKDADMVLMTRLDNDDMLLPGYIKEIQKTVKAKWPQYTSPGQLFETGGYRYNLRDGRFYVDTLHTPELTSPFLTLTSPPNKLVTVYEGNHSKMWVKHPLTIIPKQLWVQLIHETNWLLGRATNTVIAGKGKKIKIHPFVKQCRDACL